MSENMRSLKSMRVNENENFINLCLFFTILHEKNEQDPFKRKYFAENAVNCNVGKVALPMKFY